MAGFCFEPRARLRLPAVLNISLPLYLVMKLVCSHCSFFVTAANPTDMQVSWFSKGVKVARSVAVENGSFVYNDAPERLQKRFSMSSEQFSSE